MEAPLRKNSEVFRLESIAFDARARKVVNKLLADDLELVNKKQRRKGNHKPRGYFHKIFFTPADWSTLEELTTELAPFLDLTKCMEGDGPTGCLVIPEFYALKFHLASRVEELSLVPGNLFQLFKSHDPEVESNEIAAYLKATHPMASNDDARKTKAVLPWWRIYAFGTGSDLVPGAIEYCVGSRLGGRQRVPLGHKYKEANEAIEAFGGRRSKKK
ncbi:uncharacterized protein MELLADRAFT_69998 [Melampsora larici-populina 98AG31]|uniref:Uncharacterized protein n=1 Tax=Melampsora larici-populina (strain 98AG31 / pathotype 3-4-7) TaxID=747676 RepID=F4SD45_MELLP|nr:uncharacterized protein MELLADRAFT_69998 [Melampsora larici-populina 98AG31]EGF97432.1 hypothetical protein MELLADRAFT_69998 [Melampsora larici-populina 98AG31]